MDTTSIKLELLERLANLRDERLIVQITELLKKSFPQVMEDDEDLTEEELAELERRRQRYLSGESKPHSLEESMRLAREGFKP
ncbi:MAG TPA: addiction module protein [Flavobacteriales bacterium]|nr:addiction module protein [Flavobacteriales bacterium]